MRMIGSQRSTHRALMWAAALFFAFLGASRGQSILAALYVNQAMVIMAKLESCPQTWRVCSFSSKMYPVPISNVDDLSRPLLLIERARLLNDQNSIYGLHMASLLFAVGKEKQAADVLVETGWKERFPTLWFTEQPYDEPKLIMPLDRYAYYFFEGYWALTNEDWKTAVDRFRLGLSYAQERATVQVKSDFYSASAAAYAQDLTISEQERLYLSGKNRFLAGGFQEASTILEHVLAYPLTSSEKAWAANYLGQALLAQGNVEKAILVHQTGWQGDPQVRENGLHLLELLKGDDEEVSKIVEQLVAMGPTFVNGLSVSDQRILKKTVMPSGYEFIGYDLDVETIADGSPLNIYLWWRAPQNASLAEEKQIIQLGSYIVMQQEVINMAPNPGFEWGTYTDGLALGWPSRFFSNEKNSAYVIETQYDQKVTMAAFNNNAIASSTGWASIRLRLYPESWYLMATLVKDDGNAQIARVCERTPAQPGSDYYIYKANTAPLRLPNNWTSIADMGLAFGEDGINIPQWCQILLLNRDAAGTYAFWDNVILARVELPEN